MSRFALGFCCAYIPVAFGKREWWAVAFLALLIGVNVVMIITEPKGAHR